MTPPKRSPAAAWVVGVLVPIAMVMLCLSPCLPHDLRLQRMKADYARLVHPPGSRALESRSDLGLLEGNGNHCDYFVGELRVAPLDEDALKAFYRPPASIDLVAGATPFLSSSARDELVVLGGSVKAGPGETVYVVSLYDSEDPGIDMRCH